MEAKKNPLRIAFIEPVILTTEPLGVAYLAQCLINNGYKVKYFEASRKNFINKVKKFNPNILAYNISTGNYPLSQSLNRNLRKTFPKAISLFGGAHCTFFPEFIFEDKFIDGICIGEAEFSMVELVDRLRDGKDISNVKNWWLRIDDKIYKNPVRNKVADLDSLPFPNRDIIYEENISLRNTPVKRILGSRGCPYSCSYCFNKKYNEIYRNKGKIFTQRSARNIVDEILEIKKKYPVRFIKFAEDNFGLRNDIEEFSKLYKKEVNLPFLGSMRPDVVTVEKIKQLKEAGLVGITTAVESGNEFIRNKVLTRNLSTEHLEKAIEIVKKEGLKVWTQNIMGSPGETFEMVMETFNLNVKHKVHLAECALLTPYPGTDMYKYCVENDFFSGDIGSLDQSYWIGSYIKFKSDKEKRTFVNFHKFFSFGVRFPSTLPIIKLLIKLPPNKLFVLFNRLFDSWRKSKILGLKFGLREYSSLVMMNLKYFFNYFLKKNKPKKQ